MVKEKKAPKKKPLLTIKQIKRLLRVYIESIKKYKKLDRTSLQF